MGPQDKVASPIHRSEQHKRPDKSPGSFSLSTAISNLKFEISNPDTGAGNIGRRRKTIQLSLRLHQPEPLPQVQLPPPPQVQLPPPPQVQLPPPPQVLRLQQPRRPELLLQEPQQRVPPPQPEPALQPLLRQP